MNLLDRVRTLLQKQISRTFPGLFQDSNWFFEGSKIHFNPDNPKISMLIFLTASHTLHIFSWVNRFPELSRTSGLFPGLSSPGKCHNKIPGLSRFSRTCTNPDWSLEHSVHATKVCLSSTRHSQTIPFSSSYFSHVRGPCVPVLPRIMGSFRGFFVLFSSTTLETNRKYISTSWLR